MEERRKEQRAGVKGWTEAEVEREEKKVDEIEPRRRDERYKRQFPFMNDEQCVPAGCGRSSRGKVQNRRLGQWGAIGCKKGNGIIGFGNLWHLICRESETREFNLIFLTLIQCLYPILTY